MTEASGMNADIAEKLASVIKKYSSGMIVWLLTVVSVSASAYIYVGSVINGYIAFAAVLTALYILLFDFLRTKKLGGFVYLGILILICAVCVIIAGASIENAYYFVRWFFSGGQAEDTRVSFMLSVTVFMSFFFSSAVYYFSKLIYRSAMLALISMIPFALAAKASMDLPAAYYMAAASINLIVFVSDGRKNLMKGKVTGGGSAGVVYTDFVLAAILLALLIPKPQETPFYEKFEEFSNRFSFGGSGETEYKGYYKFESGNADDYVRGESKLIYILQTPEPEYMKAQVFDLYVPEANRWRAINEEISGERGWYESAELLNYKKLEEAFRAAEEADPSFYEKHPAAAALSLADDPLVPCAVYARDFEAHYVISPLRSVSADVSGIQGAEYCARSSSGEMFSNVFMPSNAAYTLKYYSGSTLEMLMANGFCDMSLHEYREALADAFDLTRKGSEERKVIRAFAEEAYAAEEYGKATKTTVSAEIQALADELTEGLEYDYEKARAIEQFFHSGQFTYDLNYKPPAGRDTAEYFIFTSRTGICGDFATAFTLIARAAGLTVRYTEGFVPQNDSAGQNIMTHYIFTDNAHAYPEVYIPGAGWTVFEPTAASLLGDDDANAFGAGNIDYAAIMLTAVTYALGLGLFIILLLLRPKMAEDIFRLKVRSKSDGMALILLYNRHIRNAEKRIGASLKAFTPEQAAEATEEITGISLMPIVKPFTAVCYGGMSIEKKDFEKAYACYKEQAKALRKRKRRDGK